MARLVMGPADDTAMTATVAAALECGIRLFDTARAYTSDPARQDEGERLLRAALSACGADADDVMVATKGGSRRVSEHEWRVDGRPAELRRSCDESLAALGVEAIDLYQLHWPDPAVPLAESVGALKDLRDEGKVRRVGLSNVGVAQLDEAAAITPIDAVQNRLGPQAPDDSAVIAWCEQHHAAYLAYEPSGGGLAPVLAAQYPAVAEVAERHGVSAPQAALAWVRAQSPCVVPLVGSTRPATVHEAAAACSLALSPDEVARLRAAFTNKNGKESA